MSPSFCFIIKDKKYFTAKYEWSFVMPILIVKKYTALCSVIFV